MGREYLIDLEEQKREITTKFYRDFQERLKKLLGKSSNKTFLISHEYPDLKDPEFIQYSFFDY